MEYRLKEHIKDKWPLGLDRCNESTQRDKQEGPISSVNLEGGWSSDAEKEEEREGLRSLPIINYRYTLDWRRRRKVKPPELLFVVSSNWSP